MTFKEKYAMKEEPRISMRQEQVLLCPEKGSARAPGRETARDARETQTQSMDKLVALLRELGRNEFFGKLLIKYESGRVVLVKKTRYIRLSRGSPEQGGKI